MLHPKFKKLRCWILNPMWFGTTSSTLPSTSYVVSSPVDLPSTSGVAPDPPQVVEKVTVRPSLGICQKWRPHEKCCHNFFPGWISCRMVSFDGGDTRPMSPPSERTSSCGGLAMRRSTSLVQRWIRMDTPKYQWGQCCLKWLFLAKQRSQILNQLVLFFVSRPKQDL